NLAGGVAHDFNNLLTIINGHADISANRATGRVLDGLNAIRDASKRAAGLINQLLLFSKREQHEPKVVAINEVVSGMHKLFSRVIGSNIELNLDLADDLWNVYADQSQMEQVVLNLVVNARDALGGNGRISLATCNFKHGDQEVVCLQVEDNGCGMDEETKGRVFEPFFSTKGTNGTGLGLSTVYGIVQQSSGEIIVESALGKGTKFKIILPRCHKETVPVEPLEEVAKSSGTANILLAEDDPDIRDMVSMVLEESGYGVVVAEDGRIALNRLNSSLKIDLLITDIIMPEMDGIELAAIVSELNIGLPVLFYSGYTAKDVPDEQTQGAPVDFLKKPFGPQELLKRVSKLLEKTSHNGSSLLAVKTAN
ncbi:MAG: response regulator, partial [Planctomycetes bacterium]|nr:response regulator [Planctomycetota bacterium]